MKPPHHPIIIMIRLSTVLDHHLEPPLGIPQQAGVFLYQVSILLLLITIITIITIIAIITIIIIITITTIIIIITIITIILTMMTKVCGR